MRSEKEMLDLIVSFAENNDSILAVTMNGSRINSGSICDRFSDFDIQYIVNDIKPFLENKKWINTFGEILIMQEPEDWYNHQYNLETKEPYAFLMQFTDGNRIDLTLIDVNNMRKYNLENEPRKILLNKAEKLYIHEISLNDIFTIKKPSEKEFKDTINEFLWLSLYVAKGINRQELCFAKTFIDQYEVEMICKMVFWKIGIDNNFLVSIGKAYKNFKRFLSDNEMKEFSAIYSNGDYNDIQAKLLYSIDYFKNISCYISKKLSYNFDFNQIELIKKYIRNIHLTTASS